MKSDGGAFWNNVYITPWCRVAAFCVGLFLGIIFYKKPKAYLSRVRVTIAYSYTRSRSLRFMMHKYNVLYNVGPQENRILRNCVFSVVFDLIDIENYNCNAKKNNKLFHDWILISSCKLPLHNVVPVSKIYTLLHFIVDRWRLLLGGVWLSQSDLLSCIVHTVKIKKMARRGHENSVLCTSPLEGPCGLLV